MYHDTIYRRLVNHQRCGRDVSIRPFDISACSSDGSKPFLAFDLIE